MISTDATPHRDVDHDIEPIFPARWSPRAMNGDSIDEAEMKRLFEAARWAPSSYNLQPWRFLYATRDSEHWSSFFDLLVEANQRWAAEAGALVVVLSRRQRDDGDAIPTHSFDAGAAWQNLALQGSAMGLVIHGMAGFDYDRARAELGIPDDFAVEAMIAVGHPGRREDLPEKLAEKETPSGRKPVAEIAFAGRFPDPAS